MTLDRGFHHVLDFYGCDPARIEDVGFWKKTLRDAAARAHMEVLHAKFHRFEPHGLTGFLLLSTSHLSVHTWPEHGHAACDLFSCSDARLARKAVDFLIREVPHADVVHRMIERGYSMPERWLDLPVYSTGGMQRLRVQEVLAEVASPFQKILVVRVDGFGRCLLIDGVMQCAESDYHLYDAAMLARMRKRDREILVIGGGDGFVARHALEKFPDSRVTVIEIDPVIVSLAREHFGAFDDPRVELLIGDGMAFLEEFRAAGRPPFDGIVLDLTDHPVGGAGKAAGFRQFYRKVLSRCARILKPAGWLSVQAGASEARKPYPDAVPIIESELQRVFSAVTRADRLIPSFGEKNAFLYAGEAKK